MLGAQYIEHIHDDLVAQLWPGTALPGPDGVRDGGLLESAVARPFRSAFGEDAYPTVFEKAVALFHSLNANHPFHDGNKRTAVIALNHFLLANDYWHIVSNAGIYEIAKRTASYRSGKRNLTRRFTSGDFKYPETYDYSLVWFEGDLVQRPSPR